MSNKLLKHIWIVLILLLISIPAVLPLLRPGFFHFSDESHIANLYEMVRSISSGQIPPRWAPDMVWTYGYPLFNFYYPFPFYLGSLFYLFTSSLVMSLKLTMLVTIFLSTVFMYLWLREYTGRLTSFIGALIYLYTPYRAVDLYIRGALGENFSFVYFPLLAFLTHRLVNNKSWRLTGILGLAIGLFVISHNLAPLLFLPWLFVYGLVCIFAEKDKSGLKKLVFSFVIGVLISAYFWLPGFIEKSYLVASTPFDYKDHFPFIRQLIFPSWGYGASLPGIHDDLSFQIGLINILLIAVLIVMSVRKFVEKKFDLLKYFFVLSILTFIILMNIRSVPFWEVTGFSNYLQFPWRLLMFTTFLSSSVFIFFKSNTFINKVVLIALGISALIINAGYFKPSEYFYPDDNYFLNKMLPRHLVGKNQYSSSPDDYRNYSEDYLLLPKWVQTRPNDEPLGKFSTKSSDLSFLIHLPKEDDRMNFKTEVIGSGLLEFNSLYFPGWYAKVNGEPVNLKILDPYGSIGIDIDGKISVVSVYWKETPLRMLSDLMSLFGLAICGILIVKNEKYKNTK